jgi:hypothetical protein
MQDWLAACLVIAASLELTFTRRETEIGLFVNRVAGQRMGELHLQALGEKK